MSDEPVQGQYGQGKENLGPKIREAECVNRRLNQRREFATLGLGVHHYAKISSAVPFAASIFCLAD